MSDLSGMLASGGLDGALAGLYGAARLKGAKKRAAGVLAGYEKTFHRGAEALFSAPGRTELGGNHTDHQHGCVLAGAVDMDLLAAVSPTDRALVRLQSEGYPYAEIDLADLTPRAEEKNSTAALVRGVYARLSELGCPLEGRGADIYMTSAVPGGSGLSSSAAFEVLMGTVFNELFWGGKLGPVELARAGQYAENRYFGKPCGLMDQTACAVGGVVFIDFEDPEDPRVEPIALDLEKAGYALCIIDSGADHADLTGEYAAITGEIRSVCRYFGKEVLREVPEETFFAGIPALRPLVGDRAVLRCMHVYADSRRAREEAEALRAGDMDRFLGLVDASGRSSAECLQNLIPTGSVRDQAVMLAIAVARRLLEGRGAVRVHGGGFGGTIQAFVPLHMLEKFRYVLEKELGAGCCHVLRIRPAGGARIG